ncbi:MAG: hypothetical protein RLY56_1167 [Pseudomonadota bacterium]
MSDRSQTPEGGTPIVGDDPVYLQDPIQDATVRMLLELAAQVWVERERRLTLEAMLETKGIIARDEIERFVPDSNLTAQIKDERTRFLEDIFKELRRIPLERKSA